MAQTHTPYTRSPENIQSLDDNISDLELDETKSTDGKESDKVLSSLDRHHVWSAFRRTIGELALGADGNAGSVSTKGLQEISDRVYAELGTQKTECTITGNSCTAQDELDELLNPQGRYAESLPHKTNYAAIRELQDMAKEIKTDHHYRVHSHRPTTAPVVWFPGGSTKRSDEELDSYLDAGRAGMRAGRFLATIATYLKQMATASSSQG